MDYVLKLDELEKDVAKELIGVEVTGRFGTGKLTEIHTSQSNFGYGFSGIIQYPTESKIFQLNIALKSGIIQMAEDKKQILDEFTDMYKDIMAAVKILEEEKKAAEKEKREKEEAERKYQEKVKASLEKANASVHTNVDTNDEDLLWLKDNGQKIHAAMPDFLEKWFVGVFGDVKRRVVDQSKKGPAGWTSQWGFSLSMKVNNSQKAPFTLRKYINEKGLINNTSFLASLVLNHDFTIG